MLVNWKISTSGNFNPRLRNRHWQEEIRAWVRNEYGQSDQGIWTVRLDIDPPRQLLPEWYEEDTILGDYLRALGRYQGDASMAISLTELLGDAAGEDWTADLARVAPADREMVLRRAALTGVEYLSRDEQTETT